MKQVKRRAAVRTRNGFDHAEVLGIVLSRTEPSAIMLAQKMLEMPVFRNRKMRGLLGAWLDERAPATVVAAGQPAIENAIVVGGLAADLDGVRFLVTLACARLDQASTIKPITSGWTISVPELERGAVSEFLASLQQTAGNA